MEDRVRDMFIDLTNECFYNYDKGINAALSVIRYIHTFLDYLDEARRAIDKTETYAVIVSDKGWMTTISFVDCSNGVICFTFEIPLSKAKYSFNEDGCSGVYLHEVLDDLENLYRMKRL